MWELGCGTEFDDAIACPVCGDSTVHPVAVRVWPLTDDGHGIDVSAESIRWFRDPIAGRVRGVCVTIGYRCESSPHYFEERRQFHKGATFAEMVRVAGSGNLDPDAAGWGWAIWRD